MITQLETVMLLANFFDEVGPVLKSHQHDQSIPGLAGHRRPVVVVPTAAPPRLVKACQTNQQRVVVTGPAAALAPTTTTTTAVRHENWWTQQKARNRHPHRNHHPQYHQPLRQHRPVGGAVVVAAPFVLRAPETTVYFRTVRSAPFASYTPVKAAIDTTFELGVTRTPSPSAASTASSTGSNGSLTSASNHSSNSHHSATSASSSGSSEKKQHLPHTVPNGHHHPVDRSNSNGLHSSNGHSGSPDGGATLLLNGGTGAADGDALFNGATGEPESIQYLKPASDEQTVNWSQGTRVTDLLF
uniref:Uncharacterized protein n=2 Tax=Anopheles melas TaxID=34690 RepID=A0A182TRS5_9DIPT